MNRCISSASKKPMLYLINKILLSAILITIISELAKRNTSLGAVFASIPLVSVIAMIWLYIDTKNAQQVAELSQNIFWLVIPSLSLFLILPMFIKHQINFYISLGMSLLIMIICYFIMLEILRRFGIKI